VQQQTRDFIVEGMHWLVHHGMPASVAMETIFMASTPSPITVPKWILLSIPCVCIYLKDFMALLVNYCCMELGDLNPLVLVHQWPHFDPGIVVYVLTSVATKLAKFCVCTLLQCDSLPIKVIIVESLRLKHCIVLEVISPLAEDCCASIFIMV
jgi:hypothetical protein